MRSEHRPGISAMQPGRPAEGSWFSGLPPSRIAAALCAVLLLIRIVAADAQINEEHIAASDFSADAWLNSKPLSLASLHGKVALIEFWNYTSIASIRTLPYLRLWDRLYRPLGLVVIGVHTPDFSFAADRTRVAAAVQRFDLTFPIAIDSERRFWTAFHNEGWPCAYLIDQHGQLDYSHCGEGDYAEFERLIQQMLKQLTPKLDFTPARFNPRPDSPPEQPCGEPTPDTYLGYSRGDRLANHGGYQQLTSAWYRPESGLAADQFDLSGHWLAAPENLQAESPAVDNPDRMRIRYRARSVYLVAGSESGRTFAVTVS